MGEGSMDYSVELSHVLKRAGALCALLFACTFLMLGIVPSAQAASLPQLASDKTTPEGAIPVSVRVSLDQPKVREDSLRLIREYRAEAYDEGIVTLPAGMTRDEYLTGFGWDAGLEQIAVQRGLEANLVVSHTRPNGESCFSAKTDTTTSYGEILAWPGRSIATGFSIWKTEKADYIKKIHGESGYGETGHYEALINPRNTAYGFAAVTVPGSHYGSCACGESGSWAANDQSVGYAGDYDAVVNIVNSSDLSAKIDVSTSKKTIGPGKTTQLNIGATLSTLSDVKAWVEPSKASFISINPEVATVDSNGVVTGVAEGKAQISTLVGDQGVGIDINVSYKEEMYRLYNPNSGEHFYTSDWSETTYLSSLGWRYEGVGWYAPTDSSTPVYRMYNPVAGEHHYTPDAAERDMLVDAGWNYEGEGWFSDDAHTTPLYRDYNPNAFANNHNYTVDVNEHQYLVSLGWRDEGIGWYGL